MLTIIVYIYIYHSMTLSIYGSQQKYITYLPQQKILVVLLHCLFKFQLRKPLNNPKSKIRKQCMLMNQYF